MARFHFTAAFAFFSLFVVPARCQELSASKVSIHLIESYSQGSSNIIASKPRVLKVLANFDRFPSGMLQAMRDYKSKAPTGKVVVRVWSPKTYSLADNATTSAIDFWNTILRPPLDALSASDRALIDYLEGPNEGQTPTLGYPNSPAGDASRWFNQFWTNLTPLMANAGYKPCIGSIAVGNPGSVSDFDPFIPAMRQANAAGGCWSYHGYTIQYSTDAALEYWYSLRYRQYQSYFVQNYPDLANMPIILTEAGVDYDGNPNTSGWQARGSAAQYKRWLNWFDWQMAQDSYVLGCTLFQAGDPGGWGSFEIEPISSWLANYLKAPTSWPAPPTGFTGVLTNGSVFLSWTNVALTPTTYAVKRATNSGGPYTLLKANITEGMPVTCYVDGSFVNGVTNYYVASAVNAVAESDHTPELCIAPGTWSTAPDAPSNLTAVPSSGRVTLSWSDPGRAAGFKVKRATASSGPYTVIASNVTGTSFADVSYSIGTLYFYVVSAFNNTGESPESNPASATPTSALPDVIVTGISWTPTNFYSGTSVLFRATIKNQGSAPVTVGQQIGIGFSIDGGGVVAWSGNFTSGLATGASTTLACDGGPSGPYWNARVGSHTVTAYVDDVNRFPEGNEDNNLLTVPFSTKAMGYLANCGGPGIGNFISDTPFTSALSVRSVTNAIDTSTTRDPAPAGVYQSERWRAFTELFPSLAPGLFKVRLHFAETSPEIQYPGQRQIHTFINGTQVLTNFDILAAAGGKFRATTRQFNASASASGEIVVQFTKGASGEPTCNGIEVFPYTNSAPVLSSIPDMTVNSGCSILYTNIATDPDVPEDKLRFLILSGPENSSIDTNTGVFSWTTPISSSPQTNTISIRVIDNGTPAKASTRWFTVTVIPRPAVSASVEAASLRLTWTSYPGRIYRVQYKNELTDEDWLPAGTDLTASDYSLSFTEPTPPSGHRFYRVIQVP